MAFDDDENDEHRGVRSVVGSVLAHAGDYAEARIALAKLEAEEASEHLRGLAVRLGIGVFASVVGYAVCVVAGIALLTKSGGSWAVPTLVVGGIHLGIGILFLLGARRQTRHAQQLFRSTRREFIKDQEWLKQKSNTTVEDELS